MRESRQRRDAGQGEIIQFMFRAYSDKHPAKTISNSPANSALEKHRHRDSGKPEADLHHTMTSFVEHFSHSEQ